MRILLAHQPVDGGVARHVVDLFLGLRAEGHEPVLCGPGLPSPSALGGQLPEDARHAPVPMGRAISPLSDLRSSRDFLRVLREVRPDVIHAHSSKAGALARAAKLLGTRVPVLYTPHGFAFAGYFEREAERTVYREVERGLGRLTDCLIAVCAAEATLAGSLRTIRHIRVVHNGIDPAADGPPDPRVRELAQRGPVLCTITGLRPGKGVETLIDALAIVRTRSPDAQLAVVGDGPLRDVLLTRAREIGVADAVHFLGAHANPQAVLRAASVFVLTSWAESFPYVILEAMSAGLPVVSSDVGGVPEMICDGESGLLVPARQPAPAAAAIERVIGDPALGQRMAQAGLERVHREFTASRMVQGTVDAYRGVLGRR